MASDVVPVWSSGMIWPIVTINNPPVNATSNAVRAGLNEAVETVAASAAKLPSSDARDAPLWPAEILPSSTNLRWSRNCRMSAMQIEACPVPFIAAMHGTVLGGGFEIALGLCISHCTCQTPNSDCPKSISA